MSELVNLEANTWSLVIATFSIVPLLIAACQPAMHFPLLALTILLLTMGSFFLFVDQNGRPANLSLAGIISVFCGNFIWIAVRRELNANGGRDCNDPDSLIGRVGEARTKIHEDGWVKLDGELWLARSEELVPAGSRVRILKQDGLALTVKKVEGMTWQRDFVAYRTSMSEQ